MCWGSDGQVGSLLEETTQTLLSSEILSVLGQGMAQIRSSPDFWAERGRNPINFPSFHPILPSNNFFYSSIKSVK